MMKERLCAMSQCSLTSLDSTCLPITRCVRPHCSWHGRFRRRPPAGTVTQGHVSTVASASSESARKKQQQRREDREASGAPALLRPAGNRSWRRPPQRAAKDIKGVLADALRQLLQELSGSGGTIAREELVSCLQAHGLRLDHRTLHSFVLQMLKAQARADSPADSSHCAAGRGGGDARDGSGDGGSSVGAAVSDREEMGESAPWQLHGHEARGRDGWQGDRGNRESLTWRQVSAIIAGFETAGVRPNERIYTTLISHAG